MTEKKLISVLGDSISSYEGYSPQAYVFYDRYTQREAGMSSVEDCWWMKVIRAMGGELGYNNSISGSMVSGYPALSSRSLKRLKSLAINGCPDSILLYMGSNDWASAVPPAEFEQAYREMLHRITSLYEEATIYCATILRGQDSPDPEMRFFNVDACVSDRIYSDIIRRCVKDYGLRLVDLEKYGVEYESIDGIHPSAAGMETIAGLWLQEII